jgi:hypothetical protein
MRILLYLLLMPFPLGCTPQRGDTLVPPRAVEGAAQEIRLEGTPRVVGTSPVGSEVVLSGDDGRTTRLTGAIAAELGRLAGARVEIWGRHAAGAMQVAGYRVLSIDGQPVVVGVVERAPDGGLRLRTEGGEVLALEGAPGELREGQKVWIRGPATVQVRGYGVIRP